MSAPPTISTAAAPITLMGATGNTGGGAVNNLLARNDSNIFVRGIVRSQEKGDAWKAKLSEKFGAERINKHVTFAIADQQDEAALTSAFTGSSAVYVMMTPEPSDPAYEEAKKRVSIITDALKAAKVTHVVILSSIGAHLTLDQCQTGGIYHTHLFEQGIIKTIGSTASITSVRAGGFFENAMAAEFPQAKFSGKYGTFYTPLDKKFPHLASKDIGVEITKRLVDRTERKTPLFVELEGPERYSINDFAAVYSKVFGREVVPFEIPQEQWSGIFQSVGIPADRTYAIENLYAGLNSGKLNWENKPENGCVSVKGTTTLEDGLTELIKKWEAQQAAAPAQNKAN